MADQILGFLGEFGTPEALLDAAKRARADGFRKLEKSLVLNAGLGE